MSRRIDAPDTDADRQLRDCLNQSPLKSFVMVAGAGSGKTTTLVKSLDYLARSRGRGLKRRGQKIACITYTEVAVGEIRGDIGSASLFHVSTIHSFLWAIVSPFQNDIREWVTGRLEEKISVAQEKISKPRTRPETVIKLTEDIERFTAQRRAVPEVAIFTYGMGSNYEKGVLGHDDILKIGPALIESKPLLRSIIGARFPFVFVDESQDTFPDFVSALRTIEDCIDIEFCLGFFGDPMQKIYATGAGAINPSPGWNEITKPENFRCPLSVMRLINNVRAEDDRLEQVRGRTISVDGVDQPVEGTARIFILPADARRSERLADVRNWLREANDDPLWTSCEEFSDVRILVVAHRMAANRLNFTELYSALNDNGSSSLKDGLLDGTSWVLRPFVKIILQLVLSTQSGSNFNVISELRANCPLFSAERIEGVDVSGLLARLRDDLDHLVGMFDDVGGGSIGDVLTFVCEREILSIDERFYRFLIPENRGVYIERDDKAVQEFLDCPASELWGYREYIENQSPFSTQQGVKGAEFQRVLVVLDDEEGSHNLFSYGKYLGFTELSDRDRRNIDTNVDSVIDRTRRLFYVCCSRAVQDLAVVLFVDDVDRAMNSVREKGLFQLADIHTF